MSGARRLAIVVNHAGFFLSHRLPIALGAQAAGYDVTVLTPRSKHVPLIAAAGLDWREIKLTRSGRNPVGELITVRSLKKAYEAVRPDLVHHVTAKPVLYGTFAARIARIPAVVNAITGMGHVFTATGIRERLVRAAIAGAYRFALSHPNMRVIFQNDFDRSAFVAQKWIDAEETVLIEGSGVDPEVYRPRAATRTVPVVVFPSRMLQTKGLEEFVEAARIVRGSGREARFVLVGEPDPDNPASLPEGVILEWVRSGAVEYEGRCDDMPRVYEESDIVCLPSWREGMPKVLIEAGACGLPAVTTDIPGCRDVVVDGVTGLLVPVRDAEAIARALIRLLDDATLRSDMGKRARERVLERFTVARVVEKTLALYASLLPVSS